MALEVADDGVHLEPGVRRAAIAAAAPRRVGSLTSKGTKRRSSPAARSASSRSRVFSEVPEPSSTSVSARGERGDLGGALGEDRRSRRVR